jgi:hypothetical protein
MVRGIIMRRSIVVTVVGLLLASCSGIAVPADKSSYIGKWEGPGMTLMLTTDGGVHYVKLSGGGKKEINAPLQAFEGNDFVVGAFGITTTFRVQKPPYQADGVWKMVVDGVELTRVPGSR